MKTLDDALKTPGKISSGVYETGWGSAASVAQLNFGGVELNGPFLPGELRRIADHLDPQPVAAPVIPEGWRLVPVEPSDEPKGCPIPGMCSCYSASANAPPLRTEADIRAEARREALEEAAAFIATQRNDVPMTGEEAACAILALIEKEPEA